MTKVKESLSLSYMRISQDLMWDCNHRLYTKEHLLKVLKYLEDQERYEECAILKTKIELRFNHKNNYTV